MGVLNLLLFLILIHGYPFALARENPSDNGIAESLFVPPPPPSPPPLATTQTAPFRPGILIIVAVISTVFSIVFLLLLYAKHCTRIVYFPHAVGVPLARENSGINRKIIETMPMFRFSSLRGQKDGLECAVCLTKFEPEEVLRLLPKCRHAFHVDCVDKWLDEHSTCPLCRYRVDPEDVGTVDTVKGKEIVGTRIVSRRMSSAGDSLEIVVENSGIDSKKGRASFDSWKSRRKSPSVNRNWDIRSKSTSSWGAFKKSGKISGRNDGDLPVQGEKHKLDHRIVISVGGEAAEEEEEKRRGSDIQAADNLYLRLELILGGEERGNGKGVINDRSVSEIAGISRFRSEKGEEGGVGKKSLRWLPKSQSHHLQKPTVNSSAAAASSAAV